MKLQKIKEVKVMYQQLKSEIKEIIEIVNQCPERLQEKCFEVLLENYLSSFKVEKSSIKKSATTLEDIERKPVEPEVQNEKSVSQANEEIAVRDFHVKIQRFLSSNNLGTKIINELYYKENGKILPLYESLKSTKMSECQIRLALLTAFENSYTDGNGEMYFNGEVVRQRCNDMKCYDSTNFSRIFKNNANLFDNWVEKYEKTTNYTLSLEGKKALAAVLVDLAKDE